jgi:hypothetical protein
MMKLSRMTRGTVPRRSGDHSPLDLLAGRLERNKTNTGLALVALLIAGTLAAAFVGGDVFDRAFALTVEVVKLALALAAGAGFSRRSR